jgi:hypothetical protein
MGRARVRRVWGFKSVRSVTAAHILVSMYSMYAYAINNQRASFANECGTHL